MSEGGYSIQPLDNTNYLLLIPLMKNCFEMNVSGDYFKWKYFNNPAGHCVGFIAIEKATHNGVSFYGAIPQKFIINGVETVIYQACDTMTHTGHRRKGLYPILARECYEFLKSRGKLFMIGIGGSEQSFPVLKHFGWRVIFHFRNYFKPSILCRLNFLKKYPSGNFVTENSLEQLDDLIMKASIPEKIRSSRDLAHYKWRISNPNYNYKIVSYRDENNISGFVIFNIQNNKIFLFDFIFGNIVSRKALLWYLSKLVLKNKYKGIVSFCQENTLQSHQLKSCLFISNPFKKGPLSDKPPFLIYSDEKTMSEYADPAKWFVTAYDYDAL